MYKNLRWKLLTVVGVTALAVWSFYPPAQKVKLGLDLQGGVHLVLQVQTDDALRLQTQTAAERLREELKTQSIDVGDVTETDATSFKVTGVPTDKDSEFRRVAQDQVGTDYDREPGVNGTYTFRMKPNIAVRTRQDTVTQALQTIERRVNELGVSEPLVAATGPNGDQIMVQLPGVTDVARAKEIIKSTAVLEWMAVDGGPASTREQLLQATGGTVPSSDEVVPGDDESGGGDTVYYLLKKVPVVSGTMLRNARPTLDEYNKPAVSFSLDAEGARRFSRFTGANIGKRVAIVLDNRVRSAPRIDSRIGGEGRITGTFSQQEVQDLSLILKSGALPASLTYLEERTVGPTLGADSVRAGVISSIAGLLAVAVFMLFYYRIAGINAIVSVTLNLVILMGFMSYVGAVMTLPGIAGFILTIGMGVDSNVLIFERIREELHAAKGVRAAVAAGFDRVFLTILDTHVASMISAGFLFQFGTGPIRGFATTLFFGLLSNLFTAVFVSRTLFETYLSRRSVTTLSI
jgi:preprotein translocase subunit SecD